MKNKFIAGIAVFVLCLATIAVQATGIARSFSDYDIVQVNSQDLSSNADKAWVLSYDTNESPIIITLHQTKRSKNYVVRAEHFEISYVCNKKGFGASYVKAEYSEFPEEIISRVINSVELDRQKILTPNQVTEDQALDLIAAYLPDLVNPSYKHLLN
jgi:hypothetical protein